MIVNYKTQWQNTLENPYRFFFPFSFLGLLYGLILVILPLSSNNIFWHKEVLITLYLLPVATGFLYTATPRFFNSYFAKEHEIFLTIIWIILLFIFALFQNTKFFILTKFVYILQVFIFVVFRFFYRKSGNPLFSPFIFVSLMSGLFGVVLQILFVFLNLTIMYRYYYVLYYYAMFWILLFGIGMKFFPMLTLTVPLSENRKYQILPKNLYNSHAFWTFYAFLFLFTFILEATDFIKTGLWIRALLVLFLSHEAWYLYFSSQRKGIYTFFIKLYLYSIVIGHFLFPIFLQYKQHLYHTIFVGGYLGLVLIVMGRVIISHEKLDLNLEVKSRYLAIIFILIYLALLTRISSQFIGTYENHLAYASITAILAILLFLYFFIKKLYQRYSIKNE